MIVGCSVAGGTGRLFVVVAVGCGSCCGWGWRTVLGAHPWFIFPITNPSPLLCALLHCCKWGNMVPMSILLSLRLGITMVLGIAAILDCSSVLMVGAGVGTGVGGIGLYFLSLK